MSKNQENIGKSTVSTASNGNPKLLLDHVLTIFRSSCGLGGGWGAFSFHMGKILWVSVLRLFQALFKKNRKKNQRT